MDNKTGKKQEQVGLTLDGWLTLQVFPKGKSFMSQSKYMNRKLIGNNKMTMI